ncbi:MAG: toll/interleukin-1 receptor domain-containing protein [Labedaea sp.]
MTQVFLNYRSDDDPFGVAMLDQALSERFGSDAVFVSSKSIPLGAHWEPMIFQAIAHSTALLAIIGRAWLDGDGRRRLDDPADYVRREILHALSLRKQVIPVRLGTPRLSISDLPPALAELAGCQDIEIRFRSHAIDVDRLAGALAEQIPELGEPVATSRELPAGAGSNSVTFHGKVRVKGDVIGRDQHKWIGPTGERGRP